ncbi:hypothetical protein SAY86_018851 [Trapa natans]|uniref:MATH domain-containing protein n=1 Tax=Trapa natans TaxID=22666 RepID=A0AAN7LB07_TRANT|nr:hypothetical protein SAY86_018851 [Trapa natans]
MDSQIPLSGSYKWRINYFTLMDQNKYYSDMFTIGGCKWRILIFPKGNNSDHFSIYLDVPDSATLPIGWYREVSITFTVINQNNQTQSTKKGMSPSQFRFS